MGRRRESEANVRRFLMKFGLYLSQSNHLSGSKYIWPRVMDFIHYGKFQESCVV